MVDIMGDVPPGDTKQEESILPVQTDNKPVLGKNRHAISAALKDPNTITLSDTGRRKQISNIPLGVGQVWIDAKTNKPIGQKDIPASALPSPGSPKVIGHILPDFPRGDEQAKQTVRVVSSDGPRLPKFILRKMEKAQ